MGHLPSRFSNIVQGNVDLFGRPFRQLAKANLVRVKNHIGSDVSLDRQLNLRKTRFVERHGDRRTTRSGVGGGIEYGQNATALAWLNRLGQNARCGAPAGRAYTPNVDRGRIRILKVKSMLGLGRTRDGSEIMAPLFECGLKLLP